MCSLQGRTSESGSIPRRTVLIAFVFNAIVDELAHVLGEKYQCVTGVEISARFPRRLQVIWRSLFMLRHAGFVHHGIRPSRAISKTRTPHGKPGSPHNVGCWLACIGEINAKRPRDRCNPSRIAGAAICDNWCLVRGPAICVCIFGDVTGAFIKFESRIIGLWQFAALPNRGEPRKPRPRVFFASA